MGAGAFEKIFSDYGMDYEKTMDRFINSRDMYLELLEIFIKDDNTDIIAASLERGDLAEAFNAAHTLKGVAGNMGLGELYGACTGLVAPLRTGDKTADYAPLYGEVKRCFENVRELYEKLSAANK